MLLSKVCGLFVVPPLPTHGNRSVEIKLEVARRLDELFELGDILELCVAVEEEGGVIGSGLSVLVELF